MTQKLSHPMLNTLETYQLNLLAAQLKSESCYLQKDPKVQHPSFFIKTRENKQKIGTLGYHPFTKTWYLESDEEYWGDDIDCLISCILDWVEDEEDIPVPIVLVQDADRKSEKE